MQAFRPGKLLLGGPTEDILLSKVSMPQTALKRCTYKCNCRSNPSKLSVENCCLVVLQKITLSKVSLPQTALKRCTYKCNCRNNPSKSPGENSLQMAVPASKFMQEK